jgi:hypothetical protein
MADPYFEIDGTSVKFAGTSLKIDTIAESTSANGVAIDGITLKDDLDTSGIVGKTTTQTLTNKRITKRVGTATSTATLTIDSDSYDEYYITAQAGALEIAAPTGTPTSGQTLLIGIKDNGSTRALTWNAAFVVIGVTLPTDTTAGKYHYIGCKYNAGALKWHVLAVSEEA